MPNPPTLNRNAGSTPKAPTECSHSLGDLKTSSLTDTMSDLKATSRNFQRDVALMKAQAAAGHTVDIEVAP